MIYAIFRIFGLVTGYPVQLLFFKRRTFYEDKKQKSLRRGGKLVVSNHFSILDYVLTSFIVFPRKLNVVACEIPFRSRIVRFGMKFFGAIQANRETRSMRFMDECTAVIKKGQLVQIFPEGRNTPDGNIHEFKMSYLVIAHRAGCPIVPVVTDGRYSPFKRASVIIGREIDVSGFFTSDKPIPDRDELRAANDFVHGEILRLRAELEVLKSRKKRKEKKFD